MGESETKVLLATFRLDQAADQVRRWDWVVPMLEKTGMSDVTELERIPGETLTVRGKKQTIMGTVTPKITYTIREEKAMIEIINRSVTPDAPVTGFIVEGRYQIVAMREGSEVRAQTNVIWVEPPGFLKS